MRNTPPFSNIAHIHTNFLDNTWPKCSGGVDGIDENNDPKVSPYVNALGDAVVHGTNLSDIRDIGDALCWSSAKGVEIFFFLGRIRRSCFNSDF